MVLLLTLLLFAHCEVWLFWLWLKTGSEADKDMAYIWSVILQYIDPCKGYVTVTYK